MTTYVLTTGNDTRNGTNGADTFDGYAGDDGIGATGGTDTLNGRGGNDIFLIDRQLTSVAGTIDGGADTDTVHAYGYDLGTLTFLNVEILSIDAFEFSARLDQLNAFSTITSAVPTMNRIMVYLQGTGGTIDLSTKMAAGKSIEFNALGLSSGYDVTGSALDDVFKNSNFDDTVRGGQGNDSFWGVYLTGNGGFDTLEGGAGADTFYLRKQSGTIDGGSGTDTVVAYQFTGTFQDHRGDLGDATFTNVERLVVGDQYLFANLGQLNSFARITGGNAGLISVDLGTSAGGTIDFTTKITGAGESVRLAAYHAGSAVTVTGSLGNDWLFGSNFNDTLRGGDGNDYLGGADFSIGAQGQDRLYGGRGNDTYYIDPTDTVIETVAGAAGGIDTVISTGSFDLANAARVQGEVENLTLNGYLGAEHPNIDGYGNALDNIITGNDGNNLLDGRAGADQLIGRGGDDTYVVDNAGDLVFEVANQGTDRVNASVSYVLAAGQSIEFLSLSPSTGTAALNLTGNELAQQLRGNAGANTLDGGGGADRLYGYGGNDLYVIDNAGDRVIEVAGQGTDTILAHVSYALQAGQSVEVMSLAPVTGTAAYYLVGNEFAQTLIGNAGNNVLDGGGGSDRLYGLGGNDTFRFSTALGTDNVDRIADFSAADDTIRLDQTIFTELGLGTLSAAAYKDIGNAGAVVDSTDRILYNHNTGQLFYDADGSGAGDRIEFAVLENRPAVLTNADFFIVA